MPTAIVLRGWLRIGDGDRDGKGHGHEYRHKHEPSGGAGELVGGWAHAALFRLLRAIDPEGVKVLHAASPKPFALAFLPLSSPSRLPPRSRSHPSPGRRPKVEADIETEAGERPLGLRIALLRDELATPILGLFLKPPPVELALGPYRFRVDTVKAAGADDPWAGRATYETLWESAEPQEELELRFLTPTTFRRGDFDYPLPDPVLMVRSWAARWRRFSPIPLPEGLLDEGCLSRLIGIRFARVKTAPFHDGHTAFPGFVGRVGLLLRGPEQERRALTALAAYAFWAGTGRKTPYGAGLTRPLLPLPKGVPHETFGSRKGKG